jgi:DNA-directed RNA polymerase
VIHSFDAAHLTRTVNVAVSAGVSAFAMIHDSFGTHAGQTTRLAAILREEFVGIYSTDWLAELRRQFVEAAPGVEFPEPPTRGDFDVTQVRDSPYFFS